MKQACMIAVSQALGRSITAGEARNIEQRIRDSMLAEARKDPNAWRALSQQQQLSEGAKRAAVDLVDEARLKKVRLAQTIAAHDRVENYVASQVQAGHDATPLDALSRLLASKSDGKGNSTSVESSAKGIVGVTMGRLSDAWEAIKPGMLGLLANKQTEAQFVSALHGQTQGVRPEIAKAAKSWLDEAEALRKRYNAAGGDVGKLDNWGMPHAWAQELAVQRGGADGSAFVDDMMQWVDRRRYVHEDGSAYSDAETRAFLKEAWLTIATNGASKPLQRSGTGGAGVKANRHNQSRQIHFKDPASTLAALQKYSGRSVFEAMVSHVGRMSRDIALIESFGPNADHTFTHFLDRYQQEQARSTPGKSAAIEQDSRNVAHLYDFVAGNRAPPASMFMARAFSALRAWMTASKLGSAAITSITDEGTLHLTAQVNNLPMFQVFLNELRAFNPANRGEKRQAQRAGLLVHTMTESLDRWGSETLGRDMPQKIASAVLRASGLNAMTEARRRAFSVTMMDALGSVTRRYATVDGLKKADMRMLAAKGITQETWDVWRAAQPETWRGNDSVLTPEAIMQAPGFSDVQKQRAATQLLAVVFDEQDMAVIEPGARERSFMQRGTEAGTLKGELVRTFWQFKAFPVAMITRHWGRALKGMETSQGKAGYMAALIAAQTVLGAVALEVNDLLSGRDPRSLNPAGKYGARNWLAAFLKGGSLGLYGDFLFAQSTEYGRTLLGALAGPGAGAVEDIDDLTRGNIVQAMKGEQTDFGAEAARFARAYTPGASLWYTKAATDRLIFQQMQEYFSPGYLARSKARQQADYGTKYWWEPGQAAKVRAPDLGAVARE